MWAVLSDVHSNLEALTAVLADIDRHPVDRLICLGDIVGYGPDPVACLDLVRRRCDTVVLGNHDDATLHAPEGFGHSAERAVHWTQRELEREECLAAREESWQFLADRPPSHRERALLFMHGSPRGPTHEFVFPEDIYNLRKMDRISAQFDWVCFCGHTHLPGALVAEDRRWDMKAGVRRPVVGEGVWAWHAPEECGHAWQLDDRKAIVNVGSVGQPRDGDPRACYVLLDRYTVRWRRVEYDVDATVRKIYAIPELRNYLGDRLRDGR